MKRILLILAALLILIFVGAVVLLNSYEEPLRKEVLNQADSYLNAELSLGGLDIQLFADFPNISVQLDQIGLSPKQKTALQPDEWVRLDQFNVSVDPWAYVFDQQIKVTNVAVDGLELYAWTGTDSTLSIMKLLKPSDQEELSTEEQGNAEETQPNALASLNLSLENYSIYVKRLFYVDSTAALEVDLQNFRHAGQVGYASNLLDLRSNTNWESLSLGINDLSYIGNASASLDLNTQADLNTQQINIQQADLAWNAIPMKIKGQANWAAPYEMDLQFDAENADLATLISSMPDDIQSTLKAYEAQGRFDLGLILRGSWLLEEEEYPQIQAFLRFQEGQLTAPEPFEDIQDIALDFSLKKAEGNFDELVFQLNDFNALVGKSSLKAKAVVSKPLSAQTINGEFVAALDLQDFKALGGDSLKKLDGLVDLNVRLNADANDFSSSGISDQSVQGTLALTAVGIEHLGLPLPLSVDELALDFKPNALSLNRLEMQFGGSKINASGQLEGLLRYLFQQGELEANLNASSSFFDLDQLADAFADTTESELAVIPLPERISFEAKAQVDQLKFGDTNYKKLSGTLVLKDQKLDFKAVKGGFLDGQLALSGSYAAKTPESANTSFKLDIQQASLGPAVQALSILNTYVPILKDADGTMNLSLDFETVLGEALKPDLEQFFADGRMEAFGATLDAPAMGKLSSALKQGDWSKINADNFLAKFRINGGNLQIDPASFKLAGNEASAGGEVSLLGALNFKGSTAANISDFNESFTAALGLQPEEGQQQIDVPFSIGGTLLKPTLSIDQEAMTAGYRMMLENKLDAEKARLRQQAQERAERILAEADSRIARLQAKLDQQMAGLEKERDNQVQSLLDKAGSNPIKKAAAKAAAEGIRKSTQRQMEQLKEQFSQQMQQIRQEAQKKAEEERKKVE